MRIEGDTDYYEVKVTASLGVTSCHSGEDVSAIIHRADKALYEAKGSGRNQVVFQKGKSKDRKNDVVPERVFRHNVRVFPSQWRFQNSKIIHLFRKRKKKMPSLFLVFFWNSSLRWRSSFVFSSFFSPDAEDLLPAEHLILSPILSLHRVKNTRKCFSAVV